MFILFHFWNVYLLYIFISFTFLFFRFALLRTFIIFLLEYTPRYIAGFI